MKGLIAGLMMLPTFAAAQDWIRLVDDASITRTLSGRMVVFDEWTRQEFGPSGETVYITERYALGRWAARGGQYCSAWPPSETWTCYDLYMSGEYVQFIGANNAVSQGQFAK